MKAWEDGTTTQSPTGISKKNNNNDTKDINNEKTKREE